MSNLQFAAKNLTERMININSISQFIESIDPLQFQRQTETRRVNVNNLDPEVISGNRLKKTDN